MFKHLKLIRLTKATLTTVKCCVKIQNVWSDLFETMQGLRQGDVLSTLLAKLQTKDTIFNKQTQFLAYADDVKIVGRSLEADYDAYLAMEAEVAKVAKILDARKTVAFGDKNFEVVNEFAYLEALVTQKNDMGLEIQL
jgi:hypothetical protein